MCIPSLLDGGEGREQRQGSGWGQVADEARAGLFLSWGHLGNEQSGVTVYIRKEVQEVHLGVCGYFSLG